MHSRPQAEAGALLSQEGSRPAEQSGPGPLIPYYVLDEAGHQCELFLRMLMTGVALPGLLRSVWFALLQLGNP